jgi:hypothetical protein
MEQGIGPGRPTDCPTDLGIIQSSGSSHKERSTVSQRELPAPLLQAGSRTPQVILMNKSTGGEGLQLGGHMIRSALQRLT